MSQFEKYLLELAYNNYLKTYDLKFKFLPKNNEELTHTTNALKSLEDDGRINMISDNLDNDKFNLLSSNDMVFVFSLTDKVLSFIKNGWKD